MTMRSRGRARTRAVLAATAAALLAWPALAQAAPSPEDLERAEAKATEAKVFFQSGLHAQAASRFMEAFAISKRPALMYNAARAYEEGRLRAEAIALFQQYMGLPDATAEGRKEALERIGKQRALINAEAAGGDKAADGAANAHSDAVAAEASKPDSATPDPAQPDSATAEPVGSDAAKPGDGAATAAATGPDPEGAPEGSLAAGTPAPAGEPRQAWVTWTALAGSAVLGLTALVSYADGVKRMNDANEMDFGGIDAAKTKSDYNAAADTAEQSRRTAVFSALAAAGLGGWVAWRLLTPDPAARAAGAEPSLYGAPALQAGGAGTMMPGWVVGGRF